MTHPAPDLDAIRLRLGEQLERGEATLFTGAGFSHGATDDDGKPIPQVNNLKQEIAELAWPDEPFDENSTLPDTFAAAVVEARNKLTAHLSHRLRVDPESVSEAHARWLSMPWRRAYTVNIDDLETAAARRFDLPRVIQPYSALTGELPLSGIADLAFIHLNGMLDEVPDVTFTEPQYGRRAGRGDFLYEQLTAELLSYPVVFVGTTLREPLFWQYVTLRDDRGPRGVAEHRPASLLVCPELSPDRRRLLATYNIRWVQMTASQFASEILGELDQAAKTGLHVLQGQGRVGEELRVPKVADLAALPQTTPSDYLLGASPEWGDIRDERAVPRTFEADIGVGVSDGVILVTGTAGAGTSTTLKRLALRALGEDRDVRWLDADDEIDVHRLGKWLRNVAHDLVLVIDDADTRGRSLQDLLADRKASLENVLLILGMRGVRVEKTLPRWDEKGESEIEVTVPQLGDEDIARLLDALDTDNKLGILTDLSQEEREERVRQKCGRELLVAMFEATTGERFERKVADEYDELEAEQRLIYAVVAIATDLRAYLLKDEILMASGDLSNTSLYALDRLAARGLIVAVRGRYRLRHRRIAELVAGRLRNSAELLAPYRGLLAAMAVRYQTRGRGSRELRLFTALSSHRRIGTSFSLDDARALYQGVEAVCADDYHYWLQRGSYEVRHGTLTHARTSLAQAKQGRGADDYRVNTEWAYYLLKSARANPFASDVDERLSEGKAILETYMGSHGDDDPYPFHIYGSQLKGWLAVTKLDQDERARQLEALIAVVETGLGKHPGERELQVLLSDLRRDLLMLSVA